MEGNSVKQFFLGEGVVEIRFAKAIVVEHQCRWSGIAPKGCVANRVACRGPTFK